MLKITAEINTEQYNGENNHILRIFQDNKLFGITALTVTELEDLEIQITNILIKLYAYRKTMK
jgi:hypothetical protein